MSDKSCLRTWLLAPPPMTYTFVGAAEASGAPPPDFAGYRLRTSSLTAKDIPSRTARAFSDKSPEGGPPFPSIHALSAPRRSGKK